MDLDQDAVLAQDLATATDTAMVVAAAEPTTEVELDQDLDTATEMAATTALVILLVT
jgi:exoribonuclease II